MLRKKLISILSYLLEVSLYLLPVFFIFKPSYGISIYAWIFGFFLLKLFVEKRFPDFRTPITLFLLAFSLSVILPSSVTIGIGNTWREGKYYIYGIVLFLILVDQIHQRRILLKRIIFLLFVLSLFLSLDALWQFYSDIDLLGNPLLANRVTAVFPNPNYLGYFLTAVVPIHVFLVQSGKTFWGKVLSIVFLIMCLIAIVVSGCRSAWVALILYLFWLICISKKKIKLFFTACIIVSIILLFGQNIVLNRLTKVPNFFDSNRIFLWKNTVALIKAHPLLGSGLDSFKEMVPVIRSYHYSFPHFFPFEIWQTSGIIALIAFAFLFYKIVAASLRYIRAKGEFSLLFFSLLMVFFTSVISIPFFTRYVSFYFWMILGLLFGAMKLEEQTQMESCAPIPDVTVSERLA